MKSLVSTLAMLLFLTGCATGRNVQILEVCPRVPVLELEIEPDALEQSFQDRIASFFSGRLPEQISYALPLSHVSQTGLRLNGN